MSEKPHASKETKSLNEQREMIDLLAGEEPKPNPAKIRAVRGSDRPVVQTHAVV
jgi:hypothetical protein